CDSLSFFSGGSKPSSQRRSAFSTAQKIRAAMTYMFGVVYNRGGMEWHEDPSTARMVGNPSVSPLVSRYMVGLQRRKAQAGETSTSARAITPEIMKRLYVKNRRDYTRLKDVRIHDGDNLIARLLQCCYTLAFICMLRFDEVLRIQMQDITFHLDGSVELKLPFRKTEQNGGEYLKISPFILWPLEKDEAYLCPVRALSEWLAASDIRSGYLFQKLTRTSLRIKPRSEKEHLSADVFLEWFRRNLLAIGVDYSPYGTHSFRRGGCQYLVVHRRWNIRRVCEWGGWSTDFTHLTIVKYIISFIDEPMSSRADFFRPGQQLGKLCRTCGRSCACNI
ncbi:DNA breaking-rejoining enzyme, partial [Schizophyllum commune]